MSKRLAAFITALILLFASSASAEDLSAMTDEELYQLRTRIDMELAGRKAKEVDRNIIFENDDILLYSAGTGSSWSDGYHLSVVFLNKTSVKIGIMFDYVIINGWQFEVFDIASAIEPGVKTKLSVTLDYASADLNSVTDITDITFKFHTFTESYERTEYDSVHFIPEW